MFKIIKIIAIVLFVAIISVLAIAATKPDTFLIQRSQVINAPADKIYPLISDFHSWGFWSPYEKLDPYMERTFSGAESGKGAIYEWRSAGKAGRGRMEIMQATAPSHVSIQLDFTVPMEARNQADFTLEPQLEGKSTKVTWAMKGKNNYFVKVIQTFVNIDDIVGKDFEDGLENLKEFSEKK